MIDKSLWLNLAVALGLGLLIGAERERNKGSDPNTSSAGIRTFTIASLLGAVSTMVNFWLLVVSIFCVTIFEAIAYFNQRGKEPGLTTEVALVLLCQMLIWCLLEKNCIVCFPEIGTHRLLI